MHIDKLDDTINKYNNTYLNTTKIKQVDVKSNKYIDSSKKINNKDPKFKLGNNLRVSKYIKHFCKRPCSNWSEEFFQIKKNQK